MLQGAGAGEGGEQDAEGQLEIVPGGNGTSRGGGLLRPVQRQGSAADLVSLEGGAGKDAELRRLHLEVGLLSATWLFPCCLVFSTY